MDTNQNGEVSLGEYEAYLNLQKDSDDLVN
jgi:hypothetical protein